MDLRQTQIGASFLIALLAAVLTAQLDAQQESSITRARALAFDGERDEAIALLQQIVVASPADSDARVLLGTVLSWEGRYDEARKELELVAAGNPTHGDALPALINVELWSDHPARAEELTRRMLRNQPDNPGMLLARARALSALQRQPEARDALDRLLVIDPRNDQAREMRRDIRAALRLWQARIGSSYDRFSDGREAWRELQVSLGRTTPVGSISLRATRAERFGTEDDQVELEMYPRFRPGTYAYIAAAYSPDAVLFPEYRYAIDLYQSLGGGFEGAVGFRRLGFGSGVNIYVGALSKYYGDWLLTGRTFVTPNSAGTSRSYQGSLRRYLGSTGSYVGLRYGRGGWREEVRNRDDFEVLDSDVGAAEASIIIRRRFELSIGGSYSREDRAGRLDLRQLSLSTGLGVRF